MPAVEQTAVMAKPAIASAESLDLTQIVRAGDQLAWGNAAAEPIVLLNVLDTQCDRLGGISAFVALSLVESIRTERAGVIRFVALGGAGTNQRFQKFGALDVLPCHYSTIPSLIADGILRIDVAFVQLAPNDGAFNLGISADYMGDAIKVARTVVAEVNHQMPRTFGDTEVQASDVDIVINTSRPLLELPLSPPTDVERQIADHVSRLVTDGATLQIGIGAIPNAVMTGLCGKKDLGLHTGMISDRVVDLVEAGVLNNRRKELDAGLIVTGGLLGTRRLYAWADQNPCLRVRSARYTHDAAILAHFRRLVGINSAIEVDLTGQINAETIGNRHVGLIGGQVDFMRACAHAPEGLAIIALSSTARNGALSRIVAKLSGGIVTTARSDADIVVTEYGIAELRGRTVSERARALIAIAHPSFRRDLETASDGLV